MRILIAEDERITRMKLRRQLEKLGHDVDEASDGKQAWELFCAEPYPMVISDWDMPEMSGVELVGRIRSFKSSSYVYVVMLTGRSDKEDVVAGMEAGADDFICKPFDRNELRARLSAGQRIVDLEHHLAEANGRLRHELAVARELADAEDQKHEEALLGQSIQVRALREGIERYAESDEPLLLGGPSGAGHEAVARAVHRSSARRDRPFIYVACAHVSADAKQSIFGDSAETTADGQLGKALLAAGGTLYLENIETLDDEATQTLQRFLEDAASRRAAGQTPEPDVRVIAYREVSRVDGPGGSSPGHGGSLALAAELDRVVGVNRLSVPSLLDRKDDVVLIANHVAMHRARTMGKPIEGLSQESEERLQEYPWPGNLRELRSVIERAVMLASGPIVDVPEELLREGRRVGGYTLDRCLGQGGMGEVWLAQHALLARPSAVKLIRQEALRKSADAREILEERFRREASATARLRSPHTVELYDFGITDDGDFYYVMEHLSGLDLSSLVKNFGVLSPARAVHLLRQACISLGEAHDAGLVHRDVKPENLFVCRLGPHFDFLKLLDFGIVRAEADVDQSMSSAGDIKGTPTSLSPEQARSEETTYASDLYGLGCVAYWLLTGRHVFESPSVVALLMQHVTKAPEPLTVHRPEIPEALNAIVLQCLAKNPENRPGSAFELSEMLGALEFDQPWGDEQARDWWEDNMNSITSDSEPDPLSETVDASLSNSTCTSKGHPSVDELKEWCSGKLETGRTEFIELHLEECDECARKIGELDPSTNDDSFVNRIRDVSKTADTQPE